MTASMWRRIGTSALQGALLWWLYAASSADRWPATVPGLFAALLTASVLVPLLWYLVTDLTTLRGRVLALLGGSSAVLLALGWHFGAAVLGGPAGRAQMDGEAFAYALTVVVLCFHALPFAQAWLLRDDWRSRYPDLFRFAWRNALLVALAVLFCGAFWLLLVLWAQLFLMIGIKLFADVFYDSRFAIPAVTIALGAGIMLAGSVDRLETALREQVLALLKWLAPLASLILLLFSVALLAKTPELLATRQRTVSAALLLWLVATNVLLLNAAYQDGESDEPYPGGLARLMRVTVPFLIVTAAVAAYSIAVRIGEYGLTTSRSWAVLVAILALAYAAGYAWAASRRGRWMAAMGRANVLVAVLTIAALLSMLTPILSPHRLAAASQAKRILAANNTDDVEPFISLRFNSGAYGRARLAALAELDGHPRATEIRRLAARAIATELPHLAGNELELVARPDLVLEARPAGQPVDPALLAAVRAAAEDEAGLDLRCRTAGQPCQLLFVDLNSDGRKEAVLFGQPGGGLMFQAVDAGWHAAGWLRQNGPGLPAEEAAKLLRESEARVVPAEWSTLVLGDWVFRFQDLDPPSKTPGAGDTK